MRRVFALALAVLGSAGCFALTDVDHFQPAAGRDLRLHLRGMTPHRSHRVEIALIDAAGNLQSWARIQPLDGDDFDLVMPKALANPPYRVDFFVDPARDGFTPFDPGTTPADHQWRIDPYPLSGEGTFTHNTNFNSISPLATGNGTATIMLGTGGLADVAAEVRVSEAATGRTRVVIRHQAISGDPEVLTAPGVFELETEYRIDAWIDGNGDRVYQPPGPGMTDDHSYRTTFRPLVDTNVTATIAFSLSMADQTDVGF